MPRPSDPVNDPAMPPTRSRSIRLRDIFKPSRPSTDKDAPPVPPVSSLSASTPIIDFASAPPSRRTYLHAPQSLHTLLPRTVANSSGVASSGGMASSGGLRSTGQEDVMRKRRRALLKASQSMGLVEGVQGHEAFERNLLRKHEQFASDGGECFAEGRCELDSGERVGGEDEDGRSRAATPVDCYVPATPAVGGSVPTTPFSGC
ncbi:hypothetical protein B5807_09981 [Epicoccum nigrum]|uniref:Uncharacterized protein n=1 Tax=Epicoccum nigrum TaxID=105696 RepID=A0A1Y2LTR8_EPING|nr:hypothetical protein B5807_09981 [Epicoccum nigrum]